MAWFDTAAPELKEHLTNKGWDKLDGDAAALAAVKAHQAVEKMVGAPAEQLVKLPKDGADPTFNEVWGRVSALGKPKDAAGYELGAADDPFATAMAEASHKANLPVSVAKALAADVKAFTAGAEAAKTKAHEAAQGAEAAFLREQWGANYDMNLFLATKGAEQLGLTKEVVDALQKQEGFAKVLEGLRGVGNRLNEAQLLRGMPATEPGSMTREEAITKKATLMADRAWGAKYLAGGHDEVTLMMNLNKIIVGPAPQR